MPKRKKRKKLESIKSLKKKAWDAFATWIKDRDGHRCITCDKPASNAGHFIHGNSKRTFLDERNVHAQCVHCNINHGNLVEYADFMKRKYGWDTVDALRELSRQPWKPSRADLELVIQRYKLRLNLNL